LAKNDAIIVKFFGKPVYTVADVNAITSEDETSRK
jgi:hypothetical protein